MRANRELPPWLLPVAIGVCVAAIAMIAWRVFGGSGEVGPSKPVHAGMYDIQAEIRKHQAEREHQGGTPNK